jgi:hypothetical protein
MAKIKDIVEMAPTSFKTSLLDVLMALDPSKTKKYVPLMLKVLVNKIEEGERDRDRDSIRQDYLSELKEYYGILNLPHTMDPKVVARLLEMVGSDITKDLMNFVDSNEKGYYSTIIKKSAFLWIDFDKKGYHKKSEEGNYSSNRNEL